MLTRMNDQSPADAIATEFGSRGGTARAKALPKERQVEIARIAANARWAKAQAPESESATDSDRQTVNVDQAMAIAERSRRTIYYWIKSGKVACLRTHLGGFSSVRIYADSIPTLAHVPLTAD